jgi:hypothetical protein
MVQRRVHALAPDPLYCTKLFPPVYPMRCISEFWVSCGYPRVRTRSLSFWRSSAVLTLNHIRGNPRAAGVAGNGAAPISTRGGSTSTDGHAVLFSWCTYEDIQSDHQNGE